MSPRQTARCVHSYNARPHVPGGQGSGVRCSSNINRVRHEDRDCILYKHIYLHTRALSGQHPDPCALSALEPSFGDFSPLGLVSSRGLRPAIALSREGTCPRAGPPSPRPSRSASEVVRSRLSAVSHTRPNHSPVLTALFLVSEVSHTRPNHSPVSLQRPVCRGPRTVPRSSFFFFVSFWYDTNGT